MPDEDKTRPLFQLLVPVESAGTDEPTAGQRLKAVARDPRGRLHVATFELDARGNGTARFDLAENPGPLEVAIAPAEFDDEEVHGLQTVTTRIDTRALEAGKPMRVAATTLSTRLLRFFRAWCRDFTVRGRVVCGRGNPVPGAKVCAYDVDFFWWWASRQQVGCAVTDSDGEFEIRFRWCCGFKSQGWWARRRWQLEPALADHILPVLASLDRPPRIVPQPTPDLAVFGRLLGTGGRPERVVDPADLEEVRERLVAARRLPFAAELERLRIWPWVSWAPWLDCNPDLIFHVTQPAVGGGTAVIVAESFDQAHRNVPTDFEVTLRANRNAWCPGPVEPEPPGFCVKALAACTVLASALGDEQGPSALLGYASPAVADLPFGGSITLRGILGDEVDYYQFETLADGGAAWEPMPKGVGGFGRVYRDQATDQLVSVPFDFQTIDGRQVIESRRHYDQTHPPGNGQPSREWWWDEPQTLLEWRTAGRFDDGLYRVRLKGFKLQAGKLVGETVLPICDGGAQGGFAIRVDNRLEGGQSGHPWVPDHPCGEGTVHTCTYEPDTDILDVRFKGISVKPCDLIDATEDGPLEIDFMAHDPDGHLGSYSLRAMGGENAIVDLLTLAVPTPLTVAGYPVSKADFVGNTYQLAVKQLDENGDELQRPLWHGGVMQLKVEVKAISDLLAKSGKRCITQLELTASKRTIVSCTEAHTNTTQYGFLMLL